MSNNSPILNPPFTNVLDLNQFAGDTETLDRFGYQRVTRSDLTLRVRDHLERLAQHNPAALQNLLSPKRDHVELAMGIASIAELFGTPIEEERATRPVIEAVVYRNKDRDPVDVYFYINPDRAGGFSHTQLIDPVIVRVHPRDNMNPVYELDDEIKDVIQYDSDIEISTMVFNNGMANVHKWVGVGNFHGSDTQGTLVRRIARLIEHAYMIRYAQAKGIALTDEQIKVFNKGFSLALSETLAELKDPRRERFLLTANVPSTKQAQELSQEMAAIIKD